MAETDPVAGDESIKPVCDGSIFVCGPLICSLFL